MKRHHLIWPVCLAGLAIGCDDGAPSGDPTEDAVVGADFQLDTGTVDARTDATPTDAGPDGELPDGGPLPDGDLPDGGPLPDADLPPDAECVPPEPIVSPDQDQIANAVERETIPVGGPAGGGALLVQDVDADPDGRIDVLVARGGRVERFTEDGEAIWITPVLGTDRLAGVGDLDGDGRREVVAVAAQTVHVLDALTGRVEYTLPADIFGAGGPILTGVQTVFVADFDGDARDELYVTDGGCGREGTGWGALLNFAAGLDQPVATVIGLPRENGRCARWNALADLDADGIPEVIINDALGLSAFDARTGAQRACAEGAGVRIELAHRWAPAGVFGPGPAAVQNLDTELSLQELRPAPQGRPCGDLGQIAARWRVAGQFRTGALAFFDADEDGVPDVITTNAVANVWRVQVFSGANGAVLQTWPDARMEVATDLNGDGRPEVLVRRGFSAANPLGPLELLEPTAAGPVALWDAPVLVGGVPRLVANAGLTDRTPEFSPPIVVRDPAGARLILARDGDGDGRLETLVSLGYDGSRIDLTLAGPPGGLLTPCEPGACATTDQLAVALPDGRIGLFDAQLNPRPTQGPGVVAPTGTANLVVAHTADGGALLVGRTPNGLLTALPTQGSADASWTVALGDNTGGRAPAIGRGGVGVSDRVVGPAPQLAPNTFAGVDAATGEVVWTHRSDPATRLSPGRWTLMEAPDADLFVRLDFVTGGVAALDDEPLDTCVPIFDGDLGVLDPACPAKAMLPREITAVDAVTGDCRWRLVLRPMNNCSTPANQNVSATMLDGAPALFVSEGTWLTRLDPASGAVLSRVDLGLVPGGGGGRGGGWMRATNGAPELLHYGGNGPPEVFTPNLELVWRAPPPANVLPQSWVVRDAQAVGDEIWAVPGTGLPILRYPLVAQDPLAVMPSGTIGLVDGAAEADAAIEPRFADVRQLLPLPGIGTDGADGILVSTGEARLYALNLDGTLAWSRPLNAVAGPPLVADLDGDGNLELLIPLGDGRLQVFARPGPAAPGRVLDRACPVAPLCRPDDVGDLDTTVDAFRLCAAWSGVLDADSYEVRVVTDGGTEIEPWTPNGTALSAQFDDLKLVPGVRYRVEVRASRTDEDGTLISEAATTDGILVVDADAPQLALGVDPPRASVGAVRMVMTVDASDDDQLAGYRLEVFDALGNSAAVIGAEPLARADARVVQIWDGTDANGGALPAGAYRVRAQVEDRGGNSVFAEVPITLCAGPCP